MVTVEYEWYEFPEATCPTQEMTEGKDKYVIISKYKPVFKPYSHTTCIQILFLHTSVGIQFDR